MKHLKFPLSELRIDFQTPSLRHLVALLMVQELYFLEEKKISTREMNQLYFKSILDDELEHL